MYREAGERRGVYFNPECPNSILTTTAEHRLKSKSRVSTAQERIEYVDPLIVSRNKG